MAHTLTFTPKTDRVAHTAVRCSYSSEVTVAHSLDLPGKERSKKI